MSELLAPAGNMEALVAAISNGADAIYLGMNKFGARAYANNFDSKSILEALEYAHLRNVKVYVTMNTIIFNSELQDAYNQIDYLYTIGIDGIIVQDLALLSYITDNYPKMEAHCSTQMGIDDLEGTLLFKDLGAKRVVLSREVPIEKIKNIKLKSKMPIEIFVHGALCVSYSGNCLMSGLIGYRSGNRGRCVGSCRKQYNVINTTTNEIISNSYILSMKDLNTIEHIEELKIADSLKIEGRMKEPVYVANVVNKYRKALDRSINKNELQDLNKTFNRTFTKGYIFHEDKKNVSNILKPNNFGFKIGTITKKTKLGYEITLNCELNQNDIIRIDHNNEDVNLSVAKLYDKNDKLISTSNNVCYIKIKEKLSIGDIVYKTKDIKYCNEIEKTYPKDIRKYNINLCVYGNSGSNLSFSIECENNVFFLESDFILEKATKNPTTKEQFIKQFNRLNDTVYSLGDVEYYIEGCFIPTSKINDIRRQIVSMLNEKKLIKRESLKTIEKIENITYPINKPKLSVYCTTKEQLDAAKEMQVEIIYHKDNVIRRNENNYEEKTGFLLVGGYGGLYKYKNTNEIYTDFSFNCVNHKSVNVLHSLGAKQVCISHEINQSQIKDLVDTYKEKTGGYPNLEMIVYGRADMMFTTYCPLKVLNQCGKCKSNEYIIKDEYGEFPIISHNDCTTTILNGKILNLIDDLENIENINVFRLQFTKENKDECIRIIKMYKEKINNLKPTKLFNKDTDTRGHFNKEIL